jgi:hypothetical protein
VVLVLVVPVTGAMGGGGVVVICSVVVVVRVTGGEAHPASSAGRAIADRPMMDRIRNILTIMILLLVRDLAD